MYNVFGRRDQDYSYYHRKYKVHCRYYDEIYLQVIDDMGGLKLQRAIGTDYLLGNNCL